MPLKSRRTFPPGGFYYFQPQTQFQTTPGLTFDQAVAELIKHRLANPRFNLPTDTETVANELDEFTCVRIAQNPNYCTGTPGTVLPFPQPPKSSFRQDLGGVVAGAAKYVQNTMAGIALYAEWFGSSRPVAKEEAERRASICLSPDFKWMKDGKEMTGCPRHVQGNIAQRFNAEAADEIMKIMGILKDMNLKTPHDDKLGICDACDCPMKAKVWSPVYLILKHLRPEAKARLWEKCWIK